MKGNYHNKPSGGCTHDEWVGCKHAVILSGGGASGAYEVGVLKGLFAGDSPATNYTPLMPDIFYGHIYRRVQRVSAGC